MDYLVGFAIAPILIVVGIFYWLFFWVMPCWSMDALSSGQKAFRRFIAHMIPILLAWLIWGIVYLGGFSN